MNKKLTALFSLIIILAFIGYVIFDATREPSDKGTVQTVRDTSVKDSWTVSRTIRLKEGKLSAVAVSPDGTVFLGGDSFIESFGSDMVPRWNLKTDSRITSIAVSGDTVFASTPETIILFTSGGKLIADWGPYEENSIITSVSANRRFVAFADAGNKLVMILRKNGELFTMLGQSDEKFIIPSEYFDVALSDNLLFAANTGNRRIEKWSIDGKKLSEFGEPGTAPGAFCGCCNPAHFAIIPQGFVTAEKGINRIKIVSQDGKFVEFVSSYNNYVPSIPLDVASADGRTIYAANSFDSTLYIFTHK
jgi:hypothetical protein